MPGCVSVAAGFGHANALDAAAAAAAAAVVPVQVAVRSAILLAAGQFPDGGHGGEVGFGERSIVSNPAGQTRTVRKHVENIVRTYVYCIERKCAIRACETVARLGIRQGGKGGGSILFTTTTV